VSELPDQPPPVRRRAPKNGRRPRFVLPADHHDDERVGEVIEAFLDGPPVRTRRGPRAPRPRPMVVREARRPIPMDTRQDWDSALRHEVARLARYGRPASVVVVQLHGAATAALDRVAGRVATTIRERARETDRVTRAASDRFHVLLPETDAVDAAAFAERLHTACLERLDGRAGASAGLEVEAVAASPEPGRTLQDALRDAVVRADRR
jgi:GGDEF domain-containing protein